MMTTTTLLSQTCLNIYSLFNSWGRVWVHATFGPGIPGGPEGPARPLIPKLGKPGVPLGPLFPENVQNIFHYLVFCLKLFHSLCVIYSIINHIFSCCQLFSSSLFRHWPLTPGKPGGPCTENPLSPFSPFGPTNPGTPGSPVPPESSRTHRWIRWCTWSWWIKLIQQVHHFDISPLKLHVIQRESQQNISLLTVSADRKPQVTIRPVFICLSLYFVSYCRNPTDSTFNKKCLLCNRCVEDVLLKLKHCMIQWQFVTTGLSSFVMRTEEKTFKGGKKTILSLYKHILSCAHLCSQIHTVVNCFKHCVVFSFYFTFTFTDD